MKISRSAGYGLMAIGHIAQSQTDGLVLASRISKDYQIPLEYLLKILQSLVRANILRSKRGPHGGFCLARPAEEITILEILEAVDGTFQTQLQLAEMTNNAPFSLKMEQACEKAIQEMRQVYDKAKLSGTLR
ncbi:MAG: Rrf2 family transcriptional regulator [Sedimentisphaerales bacterium]|nr:Rrf2 family transcriptional regulator [Sedimentisphaerales bacterium]